MEQAYFLRRELAELKAAKSALSLEARLSHFDMANRYSVKAAGARDGHGGTPLSATHRRAAERCRQLSVTVTSGPERIFLDDAATLYDEMAIKAKTSELGLDAPR